MILAIDFDGVIHNPHDRTKGYKLGKPVPGAPEALRRFKDRGDTLIVHTVWGDTPENKKTISDWMIFFKVPCDYITNIKPKADWYIDDHGISFEGWDKIKI